MKFDKVKPKVQWPKQRVYQRLAQIRGDVANFNRQLNKIDGAINGLNHTKETIKTKISNKWRYQRQLEEQLKETV